MPYILDILQKQIVLIIGGPGTGKSTTIEALTKKGYCCYPEISRQVTLEAKEKGIDQLFLTNPLLFSEMLLNGRLQQFENALEEKHDMVFLDRGLPDILAYMDFIGDDYPDRFVALCHEKKYSKIFVFPPWEAIYESDNERYENFDQAQKIHIFLVNTYKKFGYDLIDVPLDSVENRISFILDKLKD